MNPLSLPAMSSSSDSFAREVHERRTILKNEIVTLTRISPAYTNRGNQTRWEGCARMDGQQVRVNLWAEHLHLARAAGYTIDMNAGDQPVNIPVLLDKGSYGWQPQSVYGADGSEYRRVKATELADGMTVIFQNEPRRIARIVNNNKGRWMDLETKGAPPLPHRIDSPWYIVREESEVATV